MAIQKNDDGFLVGYIYVSSREIEERLFTPESVFELDTVWFSADPMLIKPHLHEGDKIFKLTFHSTPYMVFDVKLFKEFCAYEKSDLTSFEIKQRELALRSFITAGVPMFYTEGNLQNDEDDEECGVLYDSSLIADIYVYDLLRLDE